VNAVEARLDHIRGTAAPKSHNARTIAALTSNPGCARRAVLDAAGVDKQRLASYTDFPRHSGSRNSRWAEAMRSRHRSRPMAARSCCGSFVST